MNTNQWPAWQRALRVYSIIYIGFLAVVFLVVAIGSVASSSSGSTTDTSSSATGSDLVTKIISSLMTLMFIPVLVFLIRVRSPKPEQQLLAKLPPKDPTK